MCVRSGRMSAWRRLCGVVPLLSFVAIEYVKPGIWRHVFLVADVVLLMVVIAMMAKEKRGAGRRL